MSRDEVVGEHLRRRDRAGAARDRASTDGRAGPPSGRTSRASRRLISSASRYSSPVNGLNARMMSRDRPVAVDRRRAGAAVCSAFASRLGFVSLTICSQKSTNTRLSWKIEWSNMYSAASPRLKIHSASGGILIPYAMFCA